jgi:RND superfamily putative drug exporter
MRHPALLAAASSIVLLALGLPFLQARFTSIDTTVLPAEAESRQVREALDEDFPPNLSLPVFAVLEQPPGSAPAGAYRAAVAALPGAARVDAAAALDNRTSLLRVSPSAGPLSGESQDLVRDMRSIPAPFEVLVGGLAADYVDQRAGISERLPLVLVLLCLTAMAVIFLMTRSVVLPVKTVLMSLLSICAAFGVLVYVFQEGRLESLLDFEGPGSLELSMPLVLLAVGFGVSTDYGVILLSRIKEAHDAGAPNREAVALGLERSGRVITAAALLFSVAVGAFATSQIVFVKELGLGVALTVLIDATIVRALLVPSLMALLGQWNWWAPNLGRRR